MADRRPDPPRSPAAAPGAVRRSLLRLCFVAGLAWGFHMVFGWSHALVETGGATAELMPAMLIGLLALYALLIALPFVPGVEIGLALLMAEGAQIAPWVYLATLLGLTLAFAVGALIPSAMLQRLLSDLRLTGPRRMLARLEPLDGDARLAALIDAAPRWLGRAARFRYLVLALLVNMPGNALLGGGGGILFLAGFSRLFSPLTTIATLALAVAPVPLLVWGLGIDAAVWLR